LSSGALQRRIVKAVTARVRKAREARGERQVLSPASNVVPSGLASRSFERRRTLNPRIAARNTSARMLALQRMAQFRRAYQQARRAWRAGRIGVRFPAGTYALRVHASVECEPPTPLRLGVAFSGTSPG
jgi:hypothetical protein